MKRIISLCLSLLMILSAFSAVNVFAADVNVDASSVEAGKLKDYFGEIDKNYFFISDFKAEKYMDEESVPENQIRLVDLVVKTEPSVNLELGIAKFWSKTDGSCGFTELGSASVLESWNLDDITLSDGTFKKSNIDHKHEDITLGIVLKNPEVITENTKVTVELKSSYATFSLDTTTMEVSYSPIADTEVDYGSVTHVFNAPITFENSSMAAFGDVLTSLSFGEEIETDDVAKALDDMVADSTNLEANKSALNDVLTEDWTKALAEAVNDKNTITVEPTTFDGIVVSMPWAALAGAVGTEDKVYAPIVKESSFVPDEYENTDDNKELALDISLGVNGTSISAPMIEQKVEIKMPSGWNLDAGVEVYHENVKLADEDVKVDDGKVIFYTDSFSNFFITGTPVVENVNEKATAVTFEITQDTVNKNMFTVSLIPAGTATQIVRFSSVDLDVVLRNDVAEPALDNCTIEVKPASGIAFPNGYERKDKTDVSVGGFSALAVAKEGNLITDSKIDLATITIKGTGKLAFNVSAVDNKIMTETTENNVGIEVYCGNANLPTVGEFEIPEIKYDLKFNLVFENQIISKKAEEIQMDIVLENALSGEKYSVAVGEAEVAEDGVTYLPLYTVEKTDKNGYKYDIATTNNNGELPKVELPGNVKYNFTISGLGYRKFWGSVQLDEDKTINIWNNAIDDGTKVNVVDDDKTTAEAVTFLVGDIYEDGIVDIYDLSAVTSYYNHTVEEDKDLAYDLNRDGKIDIVDIGYVQASYGN